MATAKKPTRKRVVKKAVVREPFWTRTRNWFTNVDGRTYERISFILIILVLLLVATCNIKKKDRIISTQTGQLDSLRDANGNAHTRGEIAVVSAEEMNRITDSIAKVIGTKPKTIYRYITTTAGIDKTVTGTRSIITVYDTVYVHDTMKLVPRNAFFVDFHDPKNPNWLSIQGIVPSNPQTFKVGLQAKLTYTDYYKKTGFLGLGAKKYYTDIGTDNPYITFTGGTTIQREPKATWKIRPGVGVGLNYNPLTKNFSYGVQAGVYLFKSK